MSRPVIPYMSRRMMLVLAQMCGAEMWDQPRAYHHFMRFLFKTTLSTARPPDSAITFANVLNTARASYHIEQRSKKYALLEVLKKKKVQFDVKDIDIFEDVYMWSIVVYRKSQDDF